MSQGEFRAHPQAGPELCSKIYELLNLAQNLQLIKKGVNETIKAVNKGAADAVILSADAHPVELLLPIVRHCEDKSIPYCFVDSQACLGRACGITRPVICCSFLHSENMSIQNQVNVLRDKIEMLFYD